MMSNLRRRPISWHAGCIDIDIYQTNIMNDQFESNYALLVRSEEKGRGILEILVYTIFFSQCGLIHMAICADSSENLCGWTRDAHSSPHDDEIAFCTELI